MTAAGLAPPEVAAAPPSSEPALAGSSLAGAAPGRRLPAQSKQARQWLDAAIVIALMAVAVGLRWRTLWTSYWGDEAIAIGIAAHPLASLPHYLARDGSPPLYYVALHYWLQLFGRSELATHVLSMLPAVLAVPAAWWSGLRLSGRWAARVAAALVATCPYLDYYATETRMYSWLVLVTVLALACFVLAYRSGSWRWWLTAGVLTSALPYIQYYGLYVTASMVLVGGGAALAARRWSTLKWTAAFGVVCAAAFVPWAPQFFYQLHNTGAPWAPRPSPLDLVADTFNSAASAGWPGLAFAVGVAAAGALARHRARARQRPSATALVAAVPVGTLLVAFIAGQVVNSWNPRYLGIAVVPGLVAVAAGLAGSRWRGLALGVAVGSLTATALPMLVDRAVTVQTAKSDVAYLLSELKPRLQRGALVISAEVTDMPVVALDLGKGYRYATAFGLLHDPLVVNWSDLPTRLQRINAASDLAPLLKTVPRGGEVLLVNPTSWGGPETPLRYRGPVKAEGVAANQAVLGDPNLRAVVTESVPRYSNPLYPMTATLFERVRGGS